MKILGHNDGPLHRIGYPSLEKIILQRSDEICDFVDDKQNMKEGSFNIIQKYEDRALFLVTSHCVGNCQYCCRQDLLSEKKEKQDFLKIRVNLLEKYLKDHPNIKEVILSGGDPLVLPFSELKLIIERLQRLNLESIRIHTRAIVYNPSLFSLEKLQLFQQENVRLVFHIVHPYEICQEVQKHILNIREHKIRIYNQFPLLRKVNDHPEVLMKHLKLLDHLYIRNLSIYMPEPVSHSAAFRINIKRMFQIIDEVNRKTPSWVNATRFVLDTPIGKMRREDLKEYISDKFAIFAKGDKEIKYPDLPTYLDDPGDLRTLLWKD